MVAETMNWTEKERERIKASFERAWYDYLKRHKLEPHRHIVIDWDTLLTHIEHDNIHD